MKKTMALLLAALILLSLAACTDNTGAFVHKQGEYCTEDNILAVRDEAKKVEGLLETAKYLVVHQSEIPAVERECIDSILEGSDFAALDGT